MRPLCLWLLFFERSSLASRVCACVCRIPLSTLGRGQRFIAFFLSVSIPFFLIRFFISFLFLPRALSSLLFLFFFLHSVESFSLYICFGARSFFTSAVFLCLSFCFSFTLLAFVGEPSVSKRCGLLSPLLLCNWSDARSTALSFSFALYLGMLSLSLFFLLIFILWAFCVVYFFLRVSSCFDGLSSVSETPVGALARDQLLD